MRAILIVCSPKECANILNGDQTILIRKICPKQLRGDTPIKPEPIDVYIYCTKDNYQLVKPKNYDRYLRFTKGAVNYSHEQTLNGKVVAKFTLKKVEELILTSRVETSAGCPYSHSRFDYITRSLSSDDLYKKSSLVVDDIYYYLLLKKGYAWHISNLQILEKPRELDYFTKRDCGKCPYNHEDMDGDECIGCIIEKAPAVYCYVDV